MVTRSKLKRGEGVLEEPNPQIGSIRSQTPLVTTHEEGNQLMPEDERAFRKVFYDMFEIAKVLYTERTKRLQGESCNQPKGNGDDG